jgi:hypothetical protein
MVQRLLLKLGSAPKLTESVTRPCGLHVMARFVFNVQLILQLQEEMGKACGMHMETMNLYNR